MFWIWLVWLLLSLPGISCARRFFRADLASGGLGALAVAYFWSFVLLSPISILCYLTRAPLWVFSAAIVALVVASGVDLARHRAWLTWPKSLRSFLSPGAVVAAFVVVTSALVGALLSGDARFHCARVRTLLDQGFNNFDPYVVPHAFSRVYHTNLHHAVLASISQLSGESYLTTWSAMLPCVKLLQAGGFYFLAFTLFRRRDVAWTSAALALLSELPVTFSVCPNQLTNHWLVALALAQLSQLVSQQRGYRRLVAFAATLIVISETHALYALFSMVVAGVVLGYCLLLPLRRSARRFLCVAILASAAPTPFLATALWVDKDASAHTFPGETQGVRGSVDERGQALAQQTRLSRDLLETERAERRGVVNFGERWRALDLRLLLSDNYWLFGVLALVVRTRPQRRRRLLATSVGALVALIFQHTPPLFTLLANLGGGDWVVLRFGAFVKIALCTLSPGVALDALLHNRFTRASWRARGHQARPILNFALFLALLAVVAPSLKSFNRYAEDVRTSLKEGPLRLNRTLRERRALSGHFSRKAVVLTERDMARYLVMLQDVHVIAADRISPKVPRGAERRADLELLLDPETRAAQATELLKKYGVSHVFLAPKTLKRLSWLRPLARGKQRTLSRWLFKLDPEQPLRRPKR